MHLLWSRRSRTSRGRLLRHRGFLWWCSILSGSLRGRRIECILDGLACVEPHCLAGCDFYRLSGLWILPLTCRSAPPRRKSRDQRHGPLRRPRGHRGWRLPRPSPPGPPPLGLTQLLERVSRSVRIGSSGAPALVADVLTVARKHAAEILRPWSIGCHVEDYMAGRSAALHPAADR